MIEPNARTDGEWAVVREHLTRHEALGHRVYSSFDTEAEAAELAESANALEAAGAAERETEAEWRFVIVQQPPWLHPIPEEPPPPPPPSPDAEARIASLEAQLAELLSRVSGPQVG